MHSCFSCKHSKDFTLEKPLNNSLDATAAAARFTCCGPPLFEGYALEHGTHSMIYWYDSQQQQQDTVNVDGGETIPDRGCGNYTICDHLRGEDLTDIRVIYFSTPKP